MTRINSLPCPIDGCTNRRQPYQVMCVLHWFRVPKPLRERILWLYKTERGSRRHVQAIGEAKRLVNDNVRSAPPTPAA